jgi:hypothetical protein
VYSYTIVSHLVIFSFNKKLQLLSLSISKQLYIYEKKVYMVMFNNSTNINKTNNFLISYQLFELKKETTTYEVVTQATNLFSFDICIL